MTDPAFQYDFYLPVSPPPPHPIREAWERGVREALSVLTVLAAFAPCAFIIWPGAARRLGVLYAVAYGIVLLPVLAVQITLAIDMTLVLAGKRPVLRGDAVGELLAELETPTRTPPALDDAAERLIDLAWAISPLSTLAGAMLGLAIQFRPDFTRRLAFESRTRRQVVAAALNARDDIGPPPKHFISEITRPAVRPARGDFALR